MKITKCFLMALAAVGILYSCQNDNTQTVDDEGAKKSVTITVSNLAKAPATRATQDDFTPEDTPVARVSELTVLFANGGTGAVLESRALSSAAAGTNAGEYIFHGVSASATQLAVTNVSGITDLDNYLTTVNALNVSSFQGPYIAATTTEPAVSASMPSVPVWVRSGDFTETGTSHTDGSVTYDLYTAGSVEVVPALARIEIGNIKCTDLNGSTEVGGLLPRFGTLEISRIGIHNTSLTTFSAAAYAYPATDEGQAAFEAATWNADDFTAVTLDGTGATGAITTYDDEVFAYNIAPSAAVNPVVPGIILKIDDATWNTNAPLAGTPAVPYYVKSTGLSGITSIAAGSIYQVSFQFTCGNVKPWNEADELICVDVTVTIPDWTIVDDLTPTFN